MMGSLQLLNTLATKPEAKKIGKELMLIEAKVNGKDTKALVDTGATNNFIAKDKAKKVNLNWKKCERWGEDREFEGSTTCQNFQKSGFPNGRVEGSSRFLGFPDGPL